ncbi:unnamed protein product [Cuscuta campestris]|uniref:MULE transposase domain-containing protein n=1 Tax=Cuscuta campestris TaxID=132261 RepID=A0A484N447_9ASTE|nr:unnamed protein product [Cuscuta campestris]
MKVVGANVHFQKLEAKCSSPAFYQSYLEMIAAQELSEFLQMEIRLKYEEEVLEFYRNGKVMSVKSKKDPQRMIQVIKSTVGRTKVKLSQKKLGEKLHLPNSGVEIGKFPVKNLDWNIIGISGQAPFGPAKKADLNNDYKFVLELVIACLECGSGGHADDITQERAFIINALITKSKVNWAAHFFKSISKHLGKPNQKYLCQGLYIGHILESMGAASEGKKYEERYWLYYLSSKGENRAGATATAEESSSDNVPLINLTKTAKRKQVVSPSISVEAPQNLALVNLEEEEEVSDQGELQRKKRRKIISPSTSGNVNSDELKEKEPAEETSAHNQSPQQLEEEIPQVQSLPTPSPQPQIDDADNQFWQLYYDWRAWKVGNSAEQLLGWDQQLKNEKIIKKCLGLPVNHSCEQILDDYWVWQRNHEDLHLEYLVTTPISEFEVDDEDTAVYKPVFSKATEDQVVLTAETQADLEATAEDFQVFSETSPALETVLTEDVQENADSPPQQNQKTAEEELQQLIQSQILETPTTPCEISNPTETEIPEKSAEILKQSTLPETNENQEEQAVEAQRNSGEAEKETQMAELEASKTPIAIFDEQNEAEERNSLSMYISNLVPDKAERESKRIADEEVLQEDAESLPMQLVQRTPSSHQVTNFHFHGSSIPTLPDEVPEIWTKKVQGLIESALASQHASFRQEIEQMEARYNKLIEKSEEKHSSNLKEISKSVEKILEIISLLSNSVSNTMDTHASDSYLQLKEVNKIKEQIANVTVGLQKQMSLLQMDIRSALAVSSANQIWIMVYVGGSWGSNNAFNPKYTIGLPISKASLFVDVISHLRGVICKGDSSVLLRITYAVGSILPPVEINDESSFQFYMDLKSIDHDFSKLPICVEFVHTTTPVQAPLPLCHDNACHALMENLSHLPISFSDTVSCSPYSSRDYSDHGSAQDLQHHLQMYSILNNFQYRTLTSNKKFLHVVCLDDHCAWTVRAVRLERSNLFQIRRFDSSHSCSVDLREGDHRQATSRLLSDLVLHRYTDASKKPYGPNDIREDMRRDYGISMSYKKALSVKNKVMSKLYGADDDSYQLLPSMCHVLAQKNPGSVISLTTNENDQFKSMFFSLCAWRQAWIHCFPILIVDGTFLKAYFRGTLLTACTQDANRQIVPLAFGICDTESKETRMWFLTNVKRALTERSNLYIISDRHEGIIYAVEQVFPSVSHGYCSEHILRNIKSKFRGKSEVIQWKFRGAARAATVKEFEEYLQLLDDEDPRIREYLNKIGNSKWSRCHSDKSRYSSMTSNLAESLNNVNNSAREFPVAKLVEFIRDRMQLWFHERSEIASSTRTPLPKKREAVLIQMQREAFRMKVCFSEISHSYIIAYGE